ncbi:MAG: hypothetical protein KatS3mg113_1090 [Planctomycetaceae bacterium]|nr:MAG: hypothetical protein KatS3mg113_1090 [Planctomycetaceae bacterium]
MIVPSPELAAALLLPALNAVQTLTHWGEGTRDESNPCRLFYDGQELEFLRAEMLLPGMSGDEPLPPPGVLPDEAIIEQIPDLSQLAEDERWRPLVELIRTLEKQRELGEISTEDFMRQLEEHMGEWFRMNRLKVQSNVHVHQHHLQRLQRDYDLVAHIIYTANDAGITTGAVLFTQARGMGAEQIVFKFRSNGSNLNIEALTIERGVAIGGTNMVLVVRRKAASIATV